MSAPSVTNIEEFSTSIQQREVLSKEGDIPRMVSEMIPTEMSTQTEAEPPNVQYEEPSLVESIGGLPAVAIIATTVGSAIIGGLPYLAYEIGKDIVNVFKDKSTDKDKIVAQPVVVNPQINNVFSPKIEQKVSQRVEQQQRQQIGRLRAYRRRATKQKK